MGGECAAPERGMGGRIVITWESDDVLCSSQINSQQIWVYANAIETAVYKMPPFVSVILYCICICISKLSSLLLCMNSKIPYCQIWYGVKSCNKRSTLRGGKWGYCGYHMRHLAPPRSGPYRASNAICLSNLNPIFFFQVHSFSALWHHRYWIVTSPKSSIKCPRPLLFV